MPRYHCKCIISHLIIWNGLQITSFSSTDQLEHCGCEDKICNDLKYRNEKAKSTNVKKKNDKKKEFCVKKTQITKGRKGIKAQRCNFLKEFIPTQNSSMPESDATNYLLKETRLRLGVGWRFDLSPLRMGRQRGRLRLATLRLYGWQLRALAGLGHSPLPLLPGCMGSCIHRLRGAISWPAIKTMGNIRKTNQKDELLRIGHRARRLLTKNPRWTTCNIAKKFLFFFLSPLDKNILTSIRASIGKIFHRSHVYVISHNISLLKYFNFHN